MEKFKDLIELYYKGQKYNEQNVGENRIFVKKSGCNLIISKDNQEEHGYYLVESIHGHDCYSYNSVSTHIYHIVEGTGEFIIEDQIISVKKGDNIKIEPNKVFYYRGKMLMTLEMMPDFKDENNFIVEKVTYEDQSPNKKRR